MDRLRRRALLGNHLPDGDRRNPLDNTRVSIAAVLALFLHLSGVRDFAGLARDVLERSLSGHIYAEVFVPTVALWSERSCLVLIDTAG